MKKLSPVVSKEVWLNPNYAIARFMGSKRAYKTKQDQKMICTVKIVNEKNLPLEAHVHLRFEGTDTWFNEKDTLDLDLYVPLSEWSKLKDLTVTEAKPTVCKQSSISNF